MGSERLASEAGDAAIIYMISEFRKNVRKRWEADAGHSLPLLQDSG
jgi:hypothetical protein